MSRVIELQEHEVVEESLAPSEVRAIQASGLIDIQPAWAADTYRLRAGAVIGAVDLGAGLALRIRPKLSIRRVVYLLSHSAGLATWDDRLVELDDDAPIDTALAEAFATAAERALRFGPESSYYSVDEDLYEIRGRIDTNRQRRRYGFPLPVSVTYDEYGVDVAENRLVLGAALQLQRIQGVQGIIRRRLRRVASALEGVRPARRDQSEMPVRFRRSTERYRPAVALARAALSGVSFDVQAGPRPVTGFTVNMNRLFEKFLEAGLTNALAHNEGTLRSQRYDHLDRAGRAHIIPDLTWMRNGRPCVVIEAKYKDPTEGSPVDQDLYQVVAYCAGLGIRKGFLVHATTPTEFTLAVRSSDIQVVVTGLDLAAPLDELREQLIRLAGAIASEPASQAVKTA